jgi:pimeloyl-ACP methyl ester carboxylesterase
MCDSALFEAQQRHFRQDRDVQVAEFICQSSIESMARDLLDKAPPRFCYAGLSMGGIVGFELFRQAPERIAALVLMNTTAEPDTQEKKTARLRQIERARSGELKTMVLEELKPNYLAEQSRKDKALMVEIIAMASRLGVDVFERQSRSLMDRPDSRATLSTIHCPVTFIAGDQDVLCPPALHTKMHEAIPGSTLHILTDCGHLSTMEKPDQVNGILESILEHAETTKEKV